MYTIYIEDLKVDAIIGILPSERKTSQPILVEAEISYQKNLDSFINYAEVVSTIENMLKDEKYGLIEDALDDILTTLGKNHIEIKTIKLKLLKPKILDNCIVGVESFRKF